jgi:hypothetical protein
MQGEWEGWVDNHTTPEGFLETSKRLSLEVTQEAFDAVCEMYMYDSNHRENILNVIPDGWEYSKSLYSVETRFEAGGVVFDTWCDLVVKPAEGELEVKVPFSEMCAVIDTEILTTNCKLALGKPIL